jgi:hypothetical protein
MIQKSHGVLDMYAQFPKTIQNLIILLNIQNHITITKLQTTMMISKNNYVNLLLYLTFIDAILFDQIIIK